MKISEQRLQNLPKKLHQTIFDYQEGIVRIERDFARIRHNGGEGHVSNKEARMINWHSNFAGSWKKIVREAADAEAKLRQKQPPLTEFSADTPLPATEIANFLLLGTQRIYFENHACQVVNVCDFPFKHAITFSSTDEKQKQFIDTLLLRLLSVLPVGLMELNFVDPLQQGQSIEKFLPLLKIEQLVSQRRVLTRSDDIEAVLGKLANEVEDIIQYRFNDAASNWFEYNSINTEKALSYKVILIFDTPEQMSDKSLWYLGRLCENGPRCGILPIIDVNEWLIGEKRYEKFCTILSSSSQSVEVFSQFPAFNLISNEYHPEQLPKQTVLNDFYAELANHYAEKMRFQKTMPDLWLNISQTGTTLLGFDIPIGWEQSGDVAKLRLGAVDSEHHVLLAGKTGSGKSNLLHVLIHSLCEKYPPNEVDLYLLDYKESTEFNIYANPVLPHARLVATESDPEYGITVLQNLVNELKKRSSLFKSTGVPDLVEYRKTTEIVLPRVLLIIDEFQVLFSEGRQVAEPAEQLLVQLLKQGRSFGIHVLLATQNIRGLNIQSVGSLSSQLGCRVALACGQEDSALILGANNVAAAELNSPPEAILNDANGAKSGNVKFVIPFAGESDSRSDLLAQLAERSRCNSFDSKTKVFSGAHLPQTPTISEYRSICTGQNLLWLGEQLTFDADSLIIHLNQRSAFNVLISGYNDLIHDGLLASMLFSVAASQSFDKIFYFNARGIEPSAAFAKVVEILGEQLKVFDEISQLPLQEIAESIGNSRIALIIDGLDSEKALHPSPTFGIPKAGDQPKPADLLKKIAEEGCKKGTFVFAFVDRWQRCSVACKDLFAFFELRVAYGMNEDDAGTLVSGGIGKFKGIDKPNRAIFVNKMTNELLWFRPFVQRSES